MSSSQETAIREVPMPTATLLRHLAALDACHEAREWVATQPDAATAWATCPRADWLVWVLGELHVRGALSRQTLVLAACACAETALPHVPAHEGRPRLAIEAARRWARGEATVEEVRAAARAAAAADAASAYAASAYAAAASATAADAADDILGDAYAAAYASRAAAAADAAAAEAARDAARDAAAARAAAAAAVRGAVPWATVEAAISQVSAA